MGQNENAAISTAADQVRNTAPFNANGEGFVAGIYEAGAAGIRLTHQEFALPGGGNRIVELSTLSATTQHATHVAGTVGAAGVDSRVEGMAPAVTLYSTNAGYSLMAMIDWSAWLPGQELALSSSNSYSIAYDTEQEVTDGSGEYTFTTNIMDAAMLWAPYTMNVFSAGNYQPYSPEYDDYDSLGGGYAPNKNALTVGAVNDAVTNGTRDIYTADFYSYSSQGPTDDGRIKPDLVGNGIGLRSADDDSDTDTAILSGTSMSGPNVTGSLILVADYFDQRFPGRTLRGDTLKALAIHTADDLGVAGPDYKYGWGLMNTLAAAQIIESYADASGQQQITEGYLSSTDTSDTYTFTWDGSSEIRATLAWFDEPGVSSYTNDDRTPDIVNDLNLKITAPDGTTEYLPFVMPWVVNGFSDEQDYDDPAIPGINHIDTVEQVLISSPVQSGTYTVTVNYTGTLTNGPVGYGLIVTGMDPNLSQPAPDITSISVSSSPFNRQEVTINGSNFQLGANVTLQRSGSSDQDAYHIMVDRESSITAYFNLAELTSGNWDLIVTNPDGQSDTATTQMEVPAMVTLFAEDFDSSFDLGTSDWSETVLANSSNWTASTNRSQSGTTALHASAAHDNSHTVLQTPAIAIPSGTHDFIQFSFHHWYQLTSIKENWNQNARELVNLQYSTNGGSSWTTVEDTTSGAYLLSTVYSNTTAVAPYVGTNTFWSGGSGGWERVTVVLESSTVSGKNVTFRWQFTEDAGGNDLEGYYIDDVSLSYSSGNSAPAFTSTPPANPHTVNTGFTYNLAATDPDSGDQLSFTAPTLPAWMLLNDAGNGTATLSGTPSATGSYPVTIEVSDDNATPITATQIFTVEVVEAGGNNAPTFTSSPVTEANIDSNYTYNITTNDPDNHAVSITSVNPLPAWLNLIDNGNGTATLSGTPSTADSGDHSITLSVADFADSTQQAFSISANALPQAVISVTSDTAGAAPFLLEANGSSSTDSNGSIVSYAWDFGDGQQDTGASITHSYAAAGDYTVTLTVTDNGGGQDTATTSITVYDSGTLIFDRFETAPSTYSIITDTSLDNGGPSLFWTQNGASSFNTDQGVYMVRARHTGTSSTQSAVVYQTLSSTTNLTGGAFTTEGTYQKTGHAYLAIRYLDGTEKWALGDVSVISSTSTPVSATYEYATMNWSELDPAALNSGAGTSVNAATVLSNATAVGIYTTATGSWMINEMLQMDHIQFSTGPSNAAPTDIALDNNTLAENQPAGTAIGNLSATDADSSGFTYQLIDTGSYPDNDRFQISGSSLQSASSFDYEVRNTFTIRVQVTDGGSPAETYAENLGIHITDVSESTASNSISSSFSNSSELTQAEKDALTSEDTAPETDFDGDGVNNIWEYIYGLDPTAANDSQDTHPALAYAPETNLDATDNLSLNFKRSGSVTDVTFGLQGWDTNTSQWVNLTEGPAGDYTLTEGTPSNTGPGGAQEVPITLELNQPLGTGPYSIIRIRAVY